MAYPRHHGIELAENSEIVRLVVEKLTQTEEDALTLDSAGRIWYNTTTDAFMQSVIDPTDGVTIIKQPFVSGGAGTLTVQDEDATVMSGVQAINFIGTSVQAMIGSQALKKVNVYIPSPAWNSYFNSNAGANDTRISDVSVTSRYLSNPVGGTSGGFELGAWSAGTQQSTAHAGTLTYNTPNPCLFDDELSHIKVEVFGSNDTTVIAVAELSDVAGNTSATVQGITVTTTGWTAFYNKFNASINVSINLTALGPAGNALTNGGRFTVRISHIQTTGTYTKQQGPMFYEPTTTSNPVVTGVSIAENTIAGRWLSGVKYYTTGDSFTVGITDVDNINTITYPQPFVNMTSASYYGISAFTLSSGNLTGWTSTWDNQNASHSSTRTINVSSFRYIGTGALISAQYIDWTTGSWVNSSTQSICVDTYTGTSTDVNEDFRDEAYRLTSAWVAWSSQSALGGTDLMVQSDKLQRQTGNWTTYYPGLTNNGNYGTGNANTQYFYRGFRHANVSHSNGIFNISGVTQANLDNDNVIIWISLDAVSWYKCNDAYMGGVLSDGAGCRINSDTYPLPQLQFTLGTGGATSSGTGPSGWGIYLKIEVPSGSTVQMESIRITNW
jgi:hypothetical protein